MSAIEELIRLIKHLPGMGEKSATRLAYHLIRSDEGYNKALGGAIASIKEKIHPCPICGCYTEDDICQYCADSQRDKTLLCIVEEPQDVLSIASSGAYNGLFHVLGGAISPLDGVGPDALSFPSLMKRIEEVKTLHPQALNHWKFVPETWTVPAARRDFLLLFGEK